MLSPLALALALAGPVDDVTQVAHNVEDGTVHVVKKTGEVARDAGHSTASAAKAVGHGVASAARDGYHATKQAVHKVTE
jgi:hypothetical protein